MAFIVQTDPPTPGANAYVSVADFRAYHLERGRTVAPDDTAVAAAIVIATQYLDMRFDFVGYREQAAQTTEWPRAAAFNNRGDRLIGVPVQVVYATCEYALRQLSTELLADPEVDPSGQAVKSRSETVGPINERVEFFGVGAVELPEYPFADRIMISRGLVRNGTATRGGLQSGDVARG